MAVSPATPTPKHLVLVGGGHAHVQVIKALSQRPSDLEVTLVDLQSHACYSGMVPGCVASLYTADETKIDLEALADWSGIKFHQKRVVDIDVDEKLVHLEDYDDPISFDCISIDIGSTSRDWDSIPGAREHAIPTRPITALIEHVEQARLAAIKSGTVPNICVVGGGVAGLELAMSVTGRWKDSVHPDTTCTVLTAASELIPGESQASREALCKVLETKGVQVRYESQVSEVKPDQVVLGNDDDTVPFTHCIWATGAGAHDLAWTLQKRGLKCDEYGWFCVGPALQSQSHPHVFAAGDCAHILLDSEKQPPPKAGVYAVRAGPVLIENLTRYLQGEPLIGYELQDDFLKLLVCSHEGEALGLRFGLTMYGKWVFQLKDSIDRKFMDLFDVRLLDRPTKTGGKYDTSQYDAQDQGVDIPDPPDAAALLLRTDDDVDYNKAWTVLRTMTKDLAYREAVLRCCAASKPFELAPHS